MTNRSIKKVAVLGSGVMGSRIACHFANIGVEVLLLDIAPKALNELETKKGLALEHPLVKNRIVNEALESALKSSPSPIYDAKFRTLIKTGNLTDDLPKINACDWVIEVVVENLEIKKQLFDQVQKYRKPSTLITSNTSGIPISLMTEGRDEDFKKHFCGTHFFNPPRYLKLLEIIPGKETSPEVLQFLMNYGDLYLGKTTVMCKDTPAFIANRVGIFAILSGIKRMEELGLGVEEVDKLTGTIIGRQKSATFRTVDVVGLDTLLNVGNFLTANLKNDEAVEMFKIPAILSKMKEANRIGDKSGEGFYKKTKSADGKTEIHALDLASFEYKPSTKIKFATLEQTKTLENLKDRFPVLFAGTDKAGEYYRKTFADLFSYVSNRIPEIADEIYRIDQAICTGFGWEKGPFETWDIIGLENGIKLIETNGLKLPSWVKEMQTSGLKTFYRVEKGAYQYYDPSSKAYKTVPGTDDFIILDYLRKDKVIWQNAGASLFDLGDGILNLEFHSKMNTLGSEVIQGINTAIDKAEKDYLGLVIGNDGANFSAGANLAMLLMYALEQDFDEINMMIAQFQNTMMRARYSSIPVVAAPFNLTLGGGCELSLHADKIQAHSELYIGLVEFGVGLIPPGGGTKELTMRVADSAQEGDIELNSLKNAFLTIGMAKVATSAFEAKNLGLLKKSDGITMNKNRLISDAKSAAIHLAEKGYTQASMRKDIKVLGKSGLGMVNAGAYTMYSGGYISEHDMKISQKLGYVMCGGDLSAPTLVSEQYLLDLEREAFLSLTGEKKTIERIQNMLTTGKPLRN